MSTQLSATHEMPRNAVAMAGVPTHARPWVKLGRLKERERWHAMGLALLQKSVERELSQMKEACLHHIPTPSLNVRLPSFAKPGEQRPPQLLPPPPLSRGPIDRQDSINVKPILKARLDTHSANIIEIIGEYLNLLASLRSHVVPHLPIIVVAQDTMMSMIRR